MLCCVFFRLYYPLIIVLYGILFMDLLNRLVSKIQNNPNFDLYATEQTIANHGEI